jgi:hypothetical protein
MIMILKVNLGMISIPLSLKRNKKVLNRLLDIYLILNLDDYKYLWSKQEIKFMNKSNIQQKLLSK